MLRAVLELISYLCFSWQGWFSSHCFTRPDVQQGTNTNSSTWQRLFVTGRIPSTVPQRSWRHSHLATLSLALDFVNLETLITVLVPTKASANCPPRMNQHEPTACPGANAVRFCCTDGGSMSCWRWIILGIYYSSLSSWIETAGFQSKARSQQAREECALWTPQRCLWCGHNLGWVTLAILASYRQRFEFEFYDPQNAHIKVFLSPRIGSARTSSESSSFSRRPT